MDPKDPATAVEATRRIYGGLLYASSMSPLNELTNATHWVVYGAKTSLALEVWDFSKSGEYNLIGRCHVTFTKMIVRWIHTNFVDVVSCLSSLSICGL